MKHILEPQPNRALLTEVCCIWPLIIVVLIKIQTDDSRCVHISFWYQLWVGTLNDAKPLSAEYISSLAAIRPSLKRWETVFCAWMPTRMVQQGAVPIGFVFATH